MISEEFDENSETIEVLWQFIQLKCDCVIECKYCIGDRQ